MKTVIKALAAALTIAILSGCATAIPDPKTFSEQKGAGPLQPVKKVLVVVDMSLEFDQLPSGLAFSKDDNAKRMYEPVAKAMVDEVRRSGGEADYVLHTTKATLNIPADYSHVWLQRLDRFAKTSYNGGAGGHYISGRIWKATIGQQQKATPGKFDPVFTSEYEADNPWCFMPPLITDKEGCQKRYVDNIVQQWRKSGLK
jgi:hypothetical protein